MKWDDFALCVSKNWTLCYWFEHCFYHCCDDENDDDNDGDGINDNIIIIVVVVVVVCLFFFLLFSLAKLKHLAILNEKRDCIH